MLLYNSQVAKWDTSVIGLKLIYLRVMGYKVKCNTSFGLEIYEK